MDATTLTPAEREARDALICHYYRDEKLPGREISKKVGCSHATVYTVLANHGIPLRAPTHDDRNEFVNLSVPTWVKRAFHREAKRRGTSKSMLGHEILMANLAELPQAS